MATQSSILAWRCSWTLVAGCRAWSCKELDLTEVMEHACTCGGSVEIVIYTHLSALRFQGACGVGRLEAAPTLPSFRASHCRLISGPQPLASQSCPGGAWPGASSLWAVCPWVGAVPRKLG